MDRPLAIDENLQALVRGALTQKSVTERRYGFAAGCEAAIGAAVKGGAYPTGYALGSGFAQEVQSFRAKPNRGHSPITTYDLSGEAKPRRTSSGKAVATIYF